MQKLVLLLLLLLPLSVCWAQTEESFEATHGMSFEEMVERYGFTSEDVRQQQAKQPKQAAQVPKTCKTLSPQEKLVALNRQKTKIEDNIKHLSLNADTANPPLLKKYQQALKAKNEAIERLRAELGMPSKDAQTTKKPLKK